MLLRAQYPMSLLGKTHNVLYNQSIIKVNINPSYQSEELKFALGKVGIKALISPAGFKKSNYYASMVDIIPELTIKPEGKGEVNAHYFPTFRHFIIIDQNDEEKSYRSLLYAFAQNIQVLIR